MHINFSPLPSYYNCHRPQQSRSSYLCKCSCSQSMHTFLTVLLHHSDLLCSIARAHTHTHAPTTIHRFTGSKENIIHLLVSSGRHLLANQFWKQHCALDAIYFAVLIMKFLINALLSKCTINTNTVDA